MAKKPRFRRWTVFAKNLGFGVSFGYRNNTNDIILASVSDTAAVDARFYIRCTAAVYE